MKRRNLFMSTALMCAFFAIAFTFDNKGIHWLWSDQKPLAVILLIAAVILGILWLRTAQEVKSKKG